MTTKYSDTVDTENFALAEVHRNNYARREVKRFNSIRGKVLQQELDWDYSQKKWRIAAAQRSNEDHSFTNKRQGRSVCQAKAPNK